MERARLLTIGIALFVGASAAFAGDPTSSSTSTTTTTTTTTKPSFTASDMDKDGYVSRNEAQKAGVTDYSMADKNADGRLDADEFANAVASTTRSSQSSSSSTMTTPPKAPADSSSMRETQ